MPGNTGGSTKPIPSRLLDESESQVDSHTSSSYPPPKLDIPLALDDRSYRVVAPVVRPENFSAIHIPAFFGDENPAGDEYNIVNESQLHNTAHLPDPHNFNWSAPTEFNNWQ